MRLHGTTRDYEVRFDRDDELLPVSVIAGPIRTGKTTVLRLIDWCLGAGRHPEHPQLERVTAALLEVDLHGRPHVIARQLFSDATFVQLHATALRGLGEPHGVTKMPVGPPSDSDSLSAFLVDLCGLSGSMIRRRPSADDSETFALSYRNLSWLAYLPVDRLEGHRLLHEDRPQDRMHQHRQTLDIAFDVADAALSRAIARLNAAKLKVASLDTEIRAVERYLGDDLLTREEIEQRRAKSQKQQDDLEAKLAAIDAGIRASDSYPERLRQRAFEASSAARQISIRLRDRRTLLARLAPLRHQYSDELKKLNFVQEARQVLDPLPVVRCPVCASALNAPGIQHGTCELCGQVPPPAPEDAAVDLSSEVRSVEARLRELSNYIAEIDDHVTTLAGEFAEARAVELSTQREIDEAARQAVTPFLGERDNVTQPSWKRAQPLPNSTPQHDIALHSTACCWSAKDSQRNVGLRQREVDSLQANQATRAAVLSDLSQDSNA